MYNKPDFAQRVDCRLSALGLVLPDPPKPAGNYARHRVHNGIGLISGQFPIHNGAAINQGRLGVTLSTAGGYQAARIAALNVLSQLKLITANFTTFVGLLRVDGLIACAPDFTDHVVVLDGASDLFADVLGEQGLHARSVSGVSSLPMNLAVELVVTYATRELIAWG